jgi:arylsulfatase A-like enzyme
MSHGTFRLSFTAICVTIIFLAGSGVKCADQPNVILILTDDQGYGDVAAHGNPVLQTPHTDRLHAESIRLADFHVAPMCSPTRGQLMTGVDAMRNGCTAVCQGRSMPQSGLPFMAEFFEESGYATAHIGKWHIGDSYPFRPQDRGFQYTLHHGAWGITSLADYWGNTYFDPVLNLNGEYKKYDGFCTDIFFDESMAWVDQQLSVDNKKPFFLYLATNTPHVPDQVAEEDAAPYREMGQYEGKPIHAEFYGQIANIDDNLGRLEEFLEERGLRENTILIYMTDNGTRSPKSQKIFNAGMRGKKTEIYEGGHRVPCFLRWPDAGLDQGRDIDQLTQVQDLLPTLIDLCELDPKDASFDGDSLAGLIRGEQEKLEARMLVVQYRTSGAKWDPAAVLWNKWRLVGPRELYDLRTDLGQRSNVAREHPDVVAAMTAHYDQWYAEAFPRFEEPRRIMIGSAKANPVMLYANDWVGGYCDNPGGLRAANTTGHWDVIVEEAGVYEFELRRWPFEAELPLAAAGEGVPFFEGKGARPIAKARLRIGQHEEVVETEPSDTRATFTVQLEAGENRIETFFLGDEDVVLCSAIYVKATRLE